MSELLTKERKSMSAKDLIHVQVFRLKNSQGLGLYVKSSVLEHFARSNVLNPESLSSNAKSHYNVSNNPGWAGHMGYKLQPKEEFKSLNQWGQAIMNGTSVNISFLTVKGLAEGVTFEFEGMYSQGNVEKFLLDVKRQVKALYMEFMKEKNQTLTAELREIE